jgi:hypothetical protein
MRDWIHRVSCIGLLDEVVNSVNHKVPRAAVPRIESTENKYSGTLYIECNVEIVRDLIKEMRSISPFIPPLAIVCASHIRPHSYTL